MKLRKYFKGIVNFNVELGSKDLQSGEKFPPSSSIISILKNYWNFTLFSILKAGEYFTLNTKAKIII